MIFHIKLFKMALEIKLQASIICFLLFLSKETGRKLPALTVIMQTFTTQTMFGATGVSTGAIFSIDLRPRTFINFLHNTLPLLLTFHFAN